MSQKMNLASSARKSKVVTSAGSKRVRAEAAPFVSMKEMRAFAASQVKRKLTDLKPVKR
jgi:hypothetical protein